MISEQFLIDVRLKRLSVEDFDAYPFSLPVVRHLDSLALHPAVTFLVGENGSGKSTLLEAIAIASGFNAEGGSRNFRFGTRRSHSVLHEHLRLSRGVRKPRDGYFLRAESFFNVATEIEALDEEPAPPGVSAPPIIDGYGGTSLHEQSHGESFWSLLVERFRGKSLFLLDEPEAALSPQRQLGMLARMHDLVGEGSQFVIATHSPIIMGYPDATLYLCGADGLVRTEWSETEHVRVTRDFLLRREAMLGELLT